jgi:hypothetical protein
LHLERASCGESRSRNGKSPTPFDGQLNTFLGDQATAPELLTHEHRMGVAISATSAIICVGAARGPIHEPTLEPHRSGCIATPERSISVTMEALCLLLPPVATVGVFVERLGIVIELLASRQQRHDIFRLTPFQSPPGRYGLCTLKVLTRPAGPTGSAASSPMMTAEKVEKKKSREPISYGNRRESESYSSRGITSAGLA